MRVEVCDSPIFVLGAPRSGTSMMQWALRSHPDLWGGQESDFMIPLIADLRDVWEYGRRRGRLHWISGQDVTWGEFLGHIGVGLNSLYSSRSNGLRWVEQTPQYSLHMEDMKLLFPGARFVFMVRDGRDVVQSLRNFVEPVDHKRASQTWMRFVRAGLDFSERDQTGSLLFVSYAAAVNETEPEMRKVFEFLGEPFSQESVDFIASRDPINSSFPGEQRGGPRWRDWTREERLEFDSVAGDLLIDLGFERDRSWIARASA